MSYGTVKVDVAYMAVGPIAAAAAIVSTLVWRARKRSARAGERQRSTLESIGEVDFRMRLEDTHAEAKNLRRVIQRLEEQYGNTDRDFVETLRAEIVDRVSTGQMSTPTARAALAVLCNERDVAAGLFPSSYSSNPSNRFLIEENMITGTLNSWYMAPHTDGSGVEVFYGTVTGKAGVADGSKIHTSEAKRLGDYVFTCNDKIYKLGRKDSGAGLQTERQQRKRRKSTVDIEQEALIAEFHERMTSVGRAPGLGFNSQSEHVDSGTYGDSPMSLADYLFAHLKSEVIVLDTAGLAFIQQEVNMLNAIRDKGSTDPMQGFRMAHNVIKRVVCEICGFQKDGEKWNLGLSYSSFLAKVPRHQMSSIWDAMRKLVVWYDNLPQSDKKFSTTNAEVMANLPHLVLLARHVKLQMGIRSLLKRATTAPSPAHRLQMQKSARELAAMHGHMSSFKSESDDIVAGHIST